ncbi:MAG: PEP/pyruvate-binding domain-containing protein [Acidobacteriota bacterium]
MAVSTNGKKSDLSTDYEPQFGIFHDLIKFRVREILLVSSYYDAFILEEDGRLSERIFSEYVDLNLRFIPRIVRVSSAAEALKVLEKSSFDLVITMTRLADMDPLEFGEKVKQIIPGLPVVLLTYDWVPTDNLIKFRDSGMIDKVFYWTGDTKILLAIIKFVEDLKNVDNDIKLGVRIILVIEDSPRYYSLFLPLIYSEIMTQTRSLISEGVNDLHRMLRMRARPKILLAETYEQGKIIYKKYKNNLLGVISDVRFPRKGDIDINAGFKFAKKIKSEIPDLPFLLQSSNPANREIAYNKGLDFLNKYSSNLLEDLQIFIMNNFGFGDFIFRDITGKELGRAANLHQFIKMIDIVPDESLEFHAGKNHISIWLRARTEFETAEILRPIKVTDFDNISGIRRFIKNEIQKLIAKNQYGVITDFGHVKFDSENSFVRLGSGSLGGKARGIAFINAMLAKKKLDSLFEGVEIKTPHTFVVCSEIYEQFIKENNLQKFAIKENNNEKIAKKFLRAKLPVEIVKDLKTLLDNINYPMAVRSSSLLEDSQLLPFAGLYSTYMLPNNNPEKKKNLKQLTDAIKLVFASVFFKDPKEYVKNTNFRIEEEKMAVIIQQIVGHEYRNKFYPVFSGVAQSYNFYPISHMEPEDGVVQLALGLGPIIVEGGQVYRFSSKYPQMNPPFSSASEFHKKSQYYFYGLDLSDKNLEIFNGEKFSLKQYSLDESEKDGTLFFVASTFSTQDNAVKDTIAVKGPRIVTFANILKYNIFPLSDILNEILKIGRESFGSHIEIEFAVNLYKGKERKPEFNLLQIRPMVTAGEKIEIEEEKLKKEEIICSSVHPLGNGRINDLSDIVFINPEKFDISKSRTIASEIGNINNKLMDEGKRYILIGFGRWGTSDPWLGIPVEWHQICGAKVIIESNIRDFKIDPSQGSHFFHNMISLQMGYFHINDSLKDEFINWNWLMEQKPYNETSFIKHIRTEVPFPVLIDAKSSRGVVLKPRKTESQL